MIIRTKFLFAFILLSKSLFGQCECEEDFYAPELSFESYILFSNCIEGGLQPEVIASDDCTPEPIITSIADTISDTYCGIAPTFSLSCDYAQPLNVVLNGTLANWGPYVSETLGFRAFDDGTVRITGSIRSASNPEIRLALELNFLPGLTWSAYSALGQGYTYDYGCLDNNVPYTQWQYYRLSSFGSYLIGQDALAGTFLQIQSSTIEPGRAFQIGEGANGVVNENGISGAFQYSGSIQYNGQNVGITNGSPAEFVGLISCCPAPYINTTYLVSDLCGNSESYTQIIELRDHSAPVGNNVVTEGDFLFCDQTPNFAQQWFDDCSTPVNHYYVTPETTWTISSDQCGNFALIETAVELIYPVSEACDYFGCTDNSATNYNPSAIIDDASCNVSNIPVRVYIDSNSNGIYDSYEAICAGVWIQNSNIGASKLSVAGQDTYMPFNSLGQQTTITVLDDPNDFLSPTSQTSQTFNSANPPSILYFGFVQNRDPDEVLHLNLLPVAPICSESILELDLQALNVSATTLNSGTITIHMPEQVELVLADNLLEYSDSTVTVFYNSLNSCESSNFKLLFLPNTDAFGSIASINFSATSTASEQTTSFELPVSCGATPTLNFSAIPFGFGNDNYISPSVITYFGIFTNTTQEVIQELDLTFFPDINAALFNENTFSASHPYSMDRTFDPLRYNIHFENLNLDPSNTVSFSYKLDCSNITNATEIQQTVYYSSDNTAVASSNTIYRTIVICEDFALTYSDNLDQCISELNLNTASDFYTDFYWINNNNIYQGSEAIIPLDSLASSQFTLVGENNICLREINFDLGEIYTPRELYLTINDTIFCTGDTLILLPQSNSSALEWYNGNELIAVDDQFAVSNTMDITVVAPASGPCPAISQSLSLNRIEPATAQLQYDGDALLCSGESLLVSAAGTNGETVLFVNDSPLDDLTYEVTGSEEIRVLTTNSCFVAGDTLVTITDVFPELAFILSGDTAFCQGEAVNIDVDGVGDLSLFVNSNPVNTWPINVLTTSTVEATATNVCGTVSDSFNVLVYPNPSSDFVYDQTTQTITAVEPGTYQWLLFGDPIEGATSQSYTITQTGAYALQTTSEFGCTSSSSNEFINYIGVNETAPTNWLIYPNPTQELLYIRGLEQYIGQELNVVNALGQTVYRQQQILANTIQIDVRQLAKGVYHLRIGAKSSSFIVE